jgi:hypothetical protein
MKTILFTLITALSCLLLLTNCEKKELGNPLPSTVADFSDSITNNSIAPCTVYFTNKSILAKGYHWDFGNGKTSDIENPVTTYDTAGLYIVTLTCEPTNDVHYNSLVKTIILNIKDPNAGKVQVLYFTSRSSTGGSVHLVTLADNVPIVQDFDPTPDGWERPYGIAADTAHGKVYVTDFSLKLIYRFDADGKNPLKILDASVVGQEIVGEPEAIMVVGNKIYWGTPGGIGSANLDGSDPKMYINTGTTPPEYPVDMQYDPSTGKIYLVNDLAAYTGGYYSMNFDGTGIVEHLAGIDGTALELNTITGKAYMAVYATDGTAITENGIYMSNYDGSNLTKIGDFGAKATWGIAIDNVRNKLFWGYKISNSGQDGKIIRSNLDGSGQEDWIINVSPHAMQVVWIKL